MSPLSMPNRPTVILRPTVRLVYRTSTGTAQRDRAILDQHAQREQEWPACCETGDKALARFTGCPVCVL